jgi:hypothetical protein
MLVLPTAHAGAVRLGVEGDKGRFRSQTGQSSALNMHFITWDVHSGSYLDKIFQNYGPTPVIAIGTTNRYGNEAITPSGIARGKGDRVLISLNQAAARFGKESYIRPYAEMNGYWAPYCAFTSGGYSKGKAYSTKNFKRAFKRTYLILHGGSVQNINSALVAAGMPKLSRTKDLPVTEVNVIWNPQGFGSPNIKANSANSYFPGGNYVDVVANDLYDYGRGVEWDANLDLYRAYPSKPYAIGEWGLGPGIDHPDFVQKMANFVSSHPRVQAIVFHKSEKANGYDLGSKPRSEAAYKKYILPLAG